MYHEPQSGGGARPLPLWCLLTWLAVTVPLVAQATVAPHVQGLLRRARLVVLGDITTVTPYDDGRIAVAAVHAVQTLKGERVGNTVLVVEMRDRPNAPPLFRAGVPVVVFLQPAEQNSYLRKHLPAAEYYQTISDRSACLSANSQDEAAETRALVTRIATEQQHPDTDAHRESENQRTLTFDLIAARDPTLVEDGAAGLAGLSDIATTLRPDEQRRLETALARIDLPHSVRIALVKAIGAAKLQAMVPTLQGLHDLPADVQAAVWSTLAQLGAPPTTEQWERQLASKDGSVRAAAAREYLKVADVAAIPSVANVALHDREPSVRVAAIEALGETKRPEALPPLQQAFDDESPEIYQAAVRAIDDVGGRPAAEALAKLVFEAPPANQRLALTALLLMVGNQDPLVTHIRDQHPNPDMRDLIDHGLKLEH